MLFSGATLEFSLSIEPEILLWDLQPCSSCSRRVSASLSPNSAIVHSSVVIVYLLALIELLSKCMCPLSLGKAERRQFRERFIS